MSRKLGLITLLVFALGSIATLISGVYKQDLSLIGAAVTGYGLPLSWLRRTTIAYPGSPTRYSFSFESFAVDVLFWSLIITLPAVKVYRRKHSV